MIRNLKALGLALVAMLALGAVVASAASAQGTLTTEGEEVTLTGSETGELFDNAFTSPLGKVTCDATYDGEAQGGGLLSDGATKATVTVDYTNCATHIFILGTRPTTVTMNGCHYLLTVGDTAGEGDTYDVTADLYCPEGKDVEIHLYKASDTSHTGGSICTVTIESEPNQNLEGAHLTDTTNGHVDLEGEIEGITESHEGSICGTGESENATLDVDVTIEGEDDEDEPVSIGLDH